MTDSYRQSFEDAQAELEKLLTEESELQDRLVIIRTRSEDLRKTIVSLGALLGEIGTEGKIGLTDAIRQELREHEGSWFSALAVRNYLRKREFPIDEYKQPLAVIHTTLKRLQEQGEVAPREKDGRTYYQWDGPQLDAGVTEDDIPF